MLAAANRLRRSREFGVVTRAGRRAGRGSIVVHLLTGSVAPAAAMPTAVTAAPPRSGSPSTHPAPTGAPVRAGFIVPRGVGGAVTRNAVRRRLRHLVRQRIADLPAGAVLVVRARPGAAHVPYRQLAEDLDAALSAATAPPRPKRSPQPPRAGRAKRPGVTSA